MMDARTQFLVDNEKIIIGLCKKKGVSQEDLQDFYQELLVYSITSKFDYDRNRRRSLKTYSLCFVNSKIKELKRNCRKNKVTMPLLETVHARYETNLEQLWLEYEERIQNNGFRLTSRQQEIFDMLKVGHKKVEIARILGITKQAVGKHTKYIRKKIEGKK